MKSVLFDLDNTLYPEIDFVRSGFRAVARYLGSRYELNEDSLFSQMLEILQSDGRGRIFDRLLENTRLYREERVKLLVSLYRSHRPDIKLYDDVLPTLEHLRHHSLRLGMVTDWMTSVQRNKIDALGLESLFDVIIYTDELGPDCVKPSDIPFKVALELLQVEASEAVYVGDDPAKDFPAPNSMGMLTIQVKREAPPNTADAIPKPAHARHLVNSLEEILPIIL